MICVDCGRQTPKRRCRPCERERRFGSVEVEPGRACLAPSGPHQCDLCGDVVATLDALRKDCSNHGTDREFVADGQQTADGPTDLDVLVADVRETARQTASQTGRDPFELQVVAARSLLRASREAADSDATRDAIGTALDWTTPSKLGGGPDG